MTRAPHPPREALPAPRSSDGPSRARPSAPVELFRQDELRILWADFLDSEILPEASVDLVITSPPYNVDIAYRDSRDDLSYEEYLRFTERWLERCLRLAKPKGRACVNVPLDKNKGGQQSVAADVTEIAKRVGWRYHSTIIWNEQNISRRTAWGSWKSASAPFVIAPVEVILVLYRDRWARGETHRVSDITREEFLDWTNGLWTFGGERASRVGHPSPFPLELPLRCLKLFSYVGDLVLDPFLGSGSTLVACARSRRAAVGVDVSEAYCRLAARRVLAEGLARRDASALPAVSPTS